MERQNDVLVRGALVGLGLIVLVVVAGFGLVRRGATAEDRVAAVGESDGAIPSAERDGSVEPVEGSVVADAGVDRGSGGGVAGPEPRAPSSTRASATRVPKPDAVRGIYVGSRSAGSAAALERLIELAGETEVNAFVIDIKDARGEVSHATRVSLAREIGADRDLTIENMGGLLTRLREEGIYPIARIVVFKDPLLAQARPGWSIVRRDGTLWADNRDVRWLDPFNQDVWDYNIELAREAVELGFSEIQWDYVRFPDVPGSYLRDAVYPESAGRTMPQGIRAFLIYSRERLAMPDVPQTADVFGVTTTARHDVGIGQVWEELSDVTDVLLPMVYPSHYPRGTWGIEVPNAEPYRIVRRAMDDAVARSAAIAGAAGIRPWLQAFSLGEPPYGPAEIRAQIQAVYDAGLTEWILWSPGVRYPRGAFEPAGSGAITSAR